MRKVLGSEFGLMVIVVALTVINWPVLWPVVERSLRFVGWW
jgi:hypothetical protein